MCEIIISGDLCPKYRIAQLFDESRFSDVLGEVKPVVESVDYSLVNLEAPIVNGDANPITKVGPNLKCNEKVIGAIKYAGFKGVTLANNHFYDYGEEGALNTFSVLENNGIDYVGAGRNLDYAKCILYKEIKGETFAFINCCEHEFSIATKTSAGSNPLEIIGQYYAIKEAQLKAKYVIVIVHGGIEMYQLPTSRMVNTYRFFIDAGADVVINHHQHCYSGYEFYNTKPIIYGLGNFCFDSKGKKNDIWFQGYMAKLSFENCDISMTPIPYRQCDSKPAVQLSVIDLSYFNQQLKKICNIISDEQQLCDEYEKFLRRTWKNYDMINPYAKRSFRWLYKNGFLPSLMSKKKIYDILNAIRCESQRERLIDSLSKRLK